MLKLGDVEERPSRWGANPAFWAGGRELVHCYAGEVEVRVTRRRMHEALEVPGVVRRTRTSDWVQLPLADIDLVVQLTRVALEANRR